MKGHCALHTKITRNDLRTTDSNLCSFLGKGMNITQAPLCRPTPFYLPEKKFGSLSNAKIKQN